MKRQIDQKYLNKFKGKNSYKRNSEFFDILKIRTVDDLVSDMELASDFFTLFYINQDRKLKDDVSSVEVFDIKGEFEFFLLLNDLDLIRIDWASYEIQKSYKDEPYFAINCNFNGKTVNEVIKKIKRKYKLTDEIINEKEVSLINLIANNFELKEDGQYVKLILGDKVLKVRKTTKNKSVSTKSLILKTFFEVKKNGDWFEHNMRKHAEGTLIPWLDIQDESSNLQCNARMMGKIKKEYKKTTHKLNQTSNEIFGFPLFDWNNGDIILLV